MCEARYEPAFGLCRRGLSARPATTCPASRRPRRRELPLVPPMAAQRCRDCLVHRQAWTRATARCGLRPPPGAETVVPGSSTRFLTDHVSARSNSVCRVVSSELNIRDVGPQLGLRLGEVPLNVLVPPTRARAQFRLGGVGLGNRPCRRCQFGRRRARRRRLGPSGPSVNNVPSIRAVPRCTAQPSVFCGQRFDKAIRRVAASIRKNRCRSACDGSSTNRP